MTKSKEEKMKKKKECKTCKPTPFGWIPTDDVYNPKCSGCGKELLTKTNKTRERAGKIVNKNWQEAHARVFSPHKFDTEKIKVTDTLTIDQLQESIKLLAENAVKTIDGQARRLLLYYYHYGETKKPPTKWKLFKLTVHHRIKKIRISIAEWIGGEDLHENCDY
jgi:hypothetical protein